MRIKTGNEKLLQFELGLSGVDTVELIRDDSIDGAVIEIAPDEIDYLERFANSTAGRMAIKTVSMFGG